MEAEWRRRLIVDIDTRARPIAGSISDEEGEHPFAGWLELASALEGAVRGAAGDSSPVEGGMDGDDLSAH